MLKQNQQMKIETTKTIIAFCRNVFRF